MSVWQHIELSSEASATGASQLDVLALQADHALHARGLPRLGSRVHGQDAQTGKVHGQGRELEHSKMHAVQCRPSPCTRPHSRCRLLPKAYEGGAVPLIVLGAHNGIKSLQALPASHSVGDAQADQHDELRGQHYPEATHAAEGILQGQAGRSQTGHTAR